MKVEVERLKESRVVLSVEVDAEGLNKEIDEVVRDFSRNYDIPGFRRGKAPRRIVERRFGRERIIQQAAEKALPRLMEEAISEGNVLPLETPELVDFKRGEGDSLIFKFEFDVFPEVKLGQYKGVEVEEEKIEIDEETVERNLRELQIRHTEVVLSEREEVQEGDTVIGTFELFVEGKAVFDKPRDFGIKVGGGALIKELEGRLIGARVGEELEFSDNISEEFARYYEIPDCAGKEGHFKVYVRELKEERVPELNDDFARDVGEYATLDELKADIRNKLKEAAEEEARDAFKRRVLDKVVQEASCELPASLIKGYLEKELETLKLNLRARGLRYDEYLLHRNLSEEALAAELLPKAKENAKRSIVLGEIAKREGLDVNEEEIEEEIRGRIEAYSADFRDDVKKFYEDPERRNEVRNYLLSEKVIDLLVTSAKKIKEGEGSDESSTNSSRTNE